MKRSDFFKILLATPLLRFVQPKEKTKIKRYPENANTGDLVNFKPYRLRSNIRLSNELIESIKLK